MTQKSTNPPNIDADSEIKTDADVIIVGAGPAGCIAAYHLALAGHKVVVVDKSPAPRLKPCGGGLTIKSIDLLPFSVASVIRSSVDSMDISLQLQNNQTLQGRDTICTFVVRSEFDQLLAQRAAEAGAIFKACQFLSFDELASKVVCRFENQTSLTARYLIGADGAHSRIRKALGAKVASRGIAVEACIPQSQLASNKHAMSFDFGVVAGGYGWVFPKGDHVNVGIYSNLEDNEVSKQKLKEYAEQKLGINQLEDIVGFPLPFGIYGPSASNRVLLAGDAAGTIEPLIGEGIHNALKSGTLAAQAVMSCINSPKATLSDKYPALLRSTRQDIAFSHWVSNSVFYAKLNEIGYKLLSLALVHRPLIRGFVCGMRLLDIAKQLPIAPLWTSQKSVTLTEVKARMADA